jgi:NADH-quinone oxidoreductase subunit M
MNVEIATQFPLLSLLLWMPLGGALLCLLFWQSDKLARWIALLTTLAVFCLSISLAVTSHAGSGWLFYEDLAWIQPYGIRYTLGMDGISLLMVLLAALLQVVAILISWQQKQHPGLFFALILILATGTIGVFLALDLILFYIFWELMLIPMFFLIGIWGQKNRVQAALKFFFFTLAGSLFLLLAIISLYLIHGGQTGDYTFALDALRQTVLTPGTEMLLYIGFMLAFVVKVPLFPFHTWLPDAHAEAPSSGSVDLAGLLLKTGVYGMIRFAFPLFPLAAERSLPLLAILALVGIFYAAWIAYVQTDIKRVIAYSSVAHLGFVMLGLAAWNQLAWEGSMLMMVNYSVTTGALFLLISMIQDRTGTRELEGLGGLWSVSPNLSAFFLLFCLSSLGLPGLANFSAEILILFGVFKAQPLWGGLAVAGVVFSAAYMLRVVQGTLWGETKPLEQSHDLIAREWLILVPLALLVVLLGVYPAPALDFLREPVSLLLKAGGMP